jgi:predicted CXXCH cytochrome family protein
VGARACAGCHAPEWKLWTGSHHQLAMQPAIDSTVLGNFKDATIDYYGTTSKFFRRADKFMVRTDGPDGALHDYEIEYTFGCSPLQQYLVSFPGGRLQALGIAWDSRPREQGGQRWFHLYPDQRIARQSPLFWTGLDQNWNFMCADCHSTNLRKNYDSRTRAFATSYAQIDVACEACHGPGSNHVAWAKNPGEWREFEANHGLLIAFDERRGAGWEIDPATGNARRNEPRRSEHEIQTCARCHARRSQIHEDYVHGQPVEDDYRVALLDPDLYFPDGQIKEEVYEYGSFIQSRMFHSGVTCTDCHEPHSGKLRGEGGNVCLQCHAAQKYDSTRHHFHKPGTAGARCVECHMPTRTYMVVDARRDHSIRIPRPDLSVKLGVPNACNQCHQDKSVQWAAQTVVKWYGHPPVGFQRYAESLASGSIGSPGAQQSLADLVADREQPAIARASALALMGRDPGPLAVAAASAGRTDASSLVRRSTSRAMSEDTRGNVSTLSPLLADPVRAVRIEAAEALAGTPNDDLPADVAAAFERATDEYIAAQELNADRPEAHLNLALLFSRERQFGNAESELNDALALDPTFAPAAVNLADLDRELGRETEGERVLRDAIAHSPDDASLQHAIGLLLVRQARKPEALVYLAEAVRLEPANARFEYVYAIALGDAGRTSEAIHVLETEIKTYPYDHDSLAALGSFYMSLGSPGNGLIYADRLLELEPDSPQAQQLVNQLRAEAERRGR